MKMTKIAGLLLAVLLAATGCAARGSAAQPKMSQDMKALGADLDVLPPFPQPAPASGSLWTDGGPGAAMMRDPRAFRVNDMLTIRVAERSLGSNEAATELSRSSQNEFGAGVAFGLEDANPQAGRFSLNNVLSSSSNSQFTGDGKTARSSRLDGFITTRVMRVLPNGDLIVAGQKTVVVNRDRQILTLVGSVRSVDVGANNQVSSASVGDLTVRLWGQGEIDSTVRQGWFMRVMNLVWPF
jgi:flagellar L-ring protein precursor FlgH